MEVITMGKTYVYVDYLNKTHAIKRNKALAKLQRDAVICNEDANTIFIADCASPYADKMLTD